MKVKPIFKILAITLSVMMLFSVVPMGVFAATPSYTEQADDYYKVVSKKDWELAPRCH